MKLVFFLTVAFAFIGVHAQNNYTQFVNPMIGTGGHGHTFPGATLPFAMVQVSPDTRIDGSWDGCSGYHYSDSIIYGFSHTHLSGTGCSDYGDIAFMPTIVSKAVELISHIDTIYYSFSHKNEITKAGYYSVLLNNGIKVELTSTTRVGFQQYTYNKGGYAWITLNLKHRDELLEGKIAEISKHSFTGFRRSKAWAQDQLVFYYFEVSKDADQVIISRNENGETKINLGYHVKAGDKIFIKTALSSADESGAKNNMESELPGWDFDKVNSEANAAWNTELNRIQVFGGSKDEKINFYTAMYHCMIHPNIMNDADGRYMGRDHQIHKADGFNYYTVFSLWDTFRALHPLLNIIDKKRSHDFIMTFKAQFEQSGRLPMWELWGNETNCMIGFHSVSVILDAYNKNAISLKELRLLYPAVKAEAMSNRFGLDKFRANGYLSIEDESESVSKTMEYSYDFYCASEIANKLAIRDDNLYFEKLARGWHNLLDINSGFMRPRNNGGWLNPFDPKEVNNNYTEANAWQYSFPIPQDFIPLYNTFLNENTLKSPTQIFNTDSKTTGRDQADISGLIGQYAHGNEPSHHIPYLFNNIDSTGKYVRKICSGFYKSKPDGLCGNEDCGQMSAWYVFSAMGFYPVNPSVNSYRYGNMLFDSVHFNYQEKPISLFKGKLPPVNSSVIYIKSNAFSLNTGEKEYYFGKGIQQTLPMISIEKNRTSAPLIESASQVFSGKMEVSIKQNNKSNNKADGSIYFRLDTINPDIMSEKYDDKVPIIIEKNTTIKAVFISPEGIQSDISTAHFYKKPNNYSIKIKSICNKQYTGGGDEALIDGLLGDDDWRKGRWQGYQSQDFEAVIDLKEHKMVKSIKCGFLQDTRSWILFPTRVVYYGSMDGIKFEEIQTINNDVSDSMLNIQRKSFETIDINREYQYIRVIAYNYGKLPFWHQGAGGDAFIFIDEITIL